MRGKPIKVKRRPTEEELAAQAEEDQMQAVDDLAKAKKVALLIWPADSPSAEAIFGCFDRMDLSADTPEDAAKDLLLAFDTAKELFAHELPNLEMVFGVFDRVFDDLDEEEDDEG